MGVILDVPAGMIDDVAKKISISLSHEDLEILDAHIAQAGLPGRSAGVHDAVHQLFLANLEAEYEAAFREMDWDEFRLWESTNMDGLQPEHWDEAPE